jgi:Tfp pilus assembly ATPase PilU
VLRGVVSQRLMPRIGGGRVPAVEVMVTNSRIEELLRENRAEEIPEAIEDGEYYDMQTMSRALIELVLDGQVEREVAAAAAPNRHDFVVVLDRAEKARDAQAQDARKVADAAGGTEPGATPFAESDSPSLRLIASEVEAPPR